MSWNDMAWRVVPAIVVPLLAAPAWGWNAHGHMVVGYIAWQNLDEAERSKITAILKGNPQLYQMLAADLGPEPTTPDEQAARDRHVFMRGTYWADMVRDKDNPMHAENRPTWHYINLPFVHESTPGENEGGGFDGEPRMNWSPGDEVQTLPQAIDACLYDAKRSDLSADQRAVRIAWLLHLIGDMHQPLHASTLFSRRYPRGDRGGNLIIVRTDDGRPINLHALWDNIGGTGRETLAAVEPQAPVGPSALEAPIPWPERVRVAEQAAQQLLSRADLSDEALDRELQIRTMLGWLGESRFIAEQVAYQAGAFPSIEAASTMEEPTALPEGYMDTGRQVAEKRLVLAGKRLAIILKDALR